VNARTRALPASARETSERRLRKFLNRADRALAEPLFADRRALYEMRLVWQIEKATGEQSVLLEQPEFSVTEINSATVACRVFFLSTEDAYLPSVVQALSQLSDQDHARLLRANGLSKFIGQFVKDGRLVGGNFMYSGRLEEDTAQVRRGSCLGQARSHWTTSMAPQSTRRTKVPLGFRTSAERQRCSTPRRWSLGT